jgi:hypothetical protein
MEIFVLARILAWQSSGPRGKAVLYVLAEEKLRGVTFKSFGVLGNQEFHLPAQPPQTSTSLGGGVVGDTKVWSAVDTEPGTHPGRSPASAHRSCWPGLCAKLLAAKAVAASRKINLNRLLLLLSWICKS